MLLKNILFRAVLFVVVSAKLKTPSVNLKCFINDHYKVYTHYLRQAKSVEVFTFQFINGTNYGTSSLSSKFYALNSEYLDIPSIIKTINMEQLSNNEVIEINLKNYSVVRGINSRANLSEKELKINRFYNSISFEPYLIQMIIIENPLTLFKYLKTTSKTLFKYIRGLNIILFSSINVNIEDVQKFLIFFWEEYQQLNIIAQAPLCCKYKNSYVIYKPFEPTEFGYGQIQINDLKDLLQNNYYLLKNHAARLNGYPLNISLFQRYPTALKYLPKLLEDSKIYTQFLNSPGLFGVDGVTMRYLSKILNFNINLCTDSECQYFGAVLDNTSVIGSLNKVLERTIDIQGNGWFIMDYEVNNLEFTLPYDYDELCVVMLKAPKVPVFLKMCLLLKGDAGIAFMLTLLMLIFINKHQHSFLDSAMDIYCILLGQPTLIIIKKSEFWRRILIGSALVFSLVITTIFTTTLFMTLQTVTYYPNMQTLEEVDRANVKMISSFDPFAKSPLKLYKSLSKKFQLDPKLKNILNCVAQGFRAGVERHYDAKLRIATEYLGPDGSPLMHVVPDCPKKMFLGYLTPMGSPYLKVIDYYLGAFVQAGLFAKWKHDFVDAIQMDIRMQRHEKEKRKVLDLSDVHAAFSVLIYGLMASFLVFSVEILKGQYDKRRQLLKRQKKN